MKMQTTLFAALLLVGCAQQPGNAENKNMPSAGDMNMSAMSMSDAQHEKMSRDGQKAAATGTMATAVGTVQAVDGAAGKIAIAHGAVAALKWPAMTMTFKATPEQLASIKAGQKVKFEFVAKGMDATITSISSMP